MVGAGEILVLAGVLVAGFGVGTLLGGEREEQEDTITGHAERMEDLARQAARRGDTQAARLFYMAAARAYLKRAREFASKGDHTGCAACISIAARNARLGCLEGMEKELSRLEKMAWNLLDPGLPGEEPRTPGGQ